MIKVPHIMDRVCIVAMLGLSRFAIPYVTVPATTVLSSLKDQIALGTELVLQYMQTTPNMSLSATIGKH
jgi:hypothetical protein